MLLGGVCKLKSVHNTPLLYTSYNNAISLFEAKNEDLHAYIIKTKAGVSSTKLAETIERLFAVEVRPHMLVVTDHLPTTSSQTPFPLLIGVFLGFLLYVSTLWEIVSAVTKQAKIFRNLGAGLSFLTCFFGIQTFILFVGGWLFAIGICYGLQLSCQMLIPATWGYSFLVAIASLFIALGLMIKGEYASYRL
jgi:hypothetical protein